MTSSLDDRNINEARIKLNETFYSTEMISSMRITSSTSGLIDHISLFIREIISDFDCHVSVKTSPNTFFSLLSRIHDEYPSNCPYTQMECRLSPVDLTVFKCPLPGMRLCIKYTTNFRENVPVIIKPMSLDGVHIDALKLSGRTSFDVELLTQIGCSKQAC